MIHQSKTRMKMLFPFLYFCDEPIHIHYIYTFLVINIIRE